MAVSTYKIALISGVLSFTICASATAVPANVSCQCKTSANLASCQDAEAQSPSWWRWITNSSTTQLHFFDLLELLHNKDADKVAMNTNTNKEQVES